VSGDDGAFDWYDARAHQLAQHFVRHADNADIVYSWVSTEMILNFARVYLVPAAQDRLPAPSHDAHVSVLIDDAKITSEEEAFGRERPGGLAGHAGIPAHQVVAADGNLTDRFRPVQGAGYYIHSLHLDTRQRAPDSADSLVLSVGEARHAYCGTLREPVCNLHVAPAPYAPHERWRHGTTSHHTRTNMRQALRLEIRLPHQHVIHGRNTLDYRQALAFDGPECTPGIKPLLHDE